MGALFLVEVFSLSLRFDTTPLLAYNHWWTNVIGLAPAALGVLFAAGAATILALTIGVGGSPEGQSALLIDRSNLPRWMAGHLVLFAIFSSLTLTIIERDLTQSSISPGIWLGAWFISGLGMVFFLAGAALPVRSWWRLFRRGWFVLVIALLIGVLAWTAGEVTGSYWETLHTSTFSAVERVLEHLGQDVVTDAWDFAMTVHGSKGDFTVFIDQSCSGYQGIGLILVFLLAFLWLDRQSLRFPNAFLLLPIGVALIWILNVLRLAALMVIGAWVSESVAVGGFHSQVGWLSFLAVSLGTVTAANHSRFLSKRPQSRTSGLSEHPEVTHLLPFVVLIALGMLTAAVSSGFDWLYPVRVLGTGVVLVTYWHGSLGRQSIRSLADPKNFFLGLAAAFVWVGIGLLGGGEEGGLDVREALAAAPWAWAAIWLFFRLVGSVLVIPIAEELAFRSYLTRRLISHDFEKVPPGSFSWMSFIGSSLVFGVLHQNWLAASVLGMLFALSYYRRGRLEDAIAVHGFANLVIVIFVWVTGYWALW
ncbi:MAG: exosortase E/protease, VPEID-CTERM system [Thermoanaerobaculia bacterium]